MLQGYEPLPVVAVPSLSLSLSLVLAVCEFGSVEWAMEKILGIRNCS
jgi:hypothetical protein